MDGQIPKKALRYTWKVENPNLDVKMELFAVNSKIC